MAEHREETGKAPGWQRQAEEQEGKVEGLVVALGQLSVADRRNEEAPTFRELDAEAHRIGEALDFLAAAVSALGRAEDPNLLEESVGLACLIEDLAGRQHSLGSKIDLLGMTSAEGTT